MAAYSYMYYVYIIFSLFLLFFLKSVINFMLKTIREYNHFYRTCWKIPAPPRMTLFGHIFYFSRDVGKCLDDLRTMTKQYYPIHRIDFFYIIGIVIIHPDDIEQLLSSQKHITKSRLYDLLHSWLGTGLLTSTGSQWQTRRKILTPAFHFSILQEFTTVFNEETNELVQSLLKLQGEEVNIEPLISDVTLKSIMETAMGTDSLDSKSKQDYRTAINKMGTVLLQRLIRPWYFLKYLYALSILGREETSLLKILHGFSKYVIDERLRRFDLKAVKARLEDDVSYTKKRKLAMLDILLLAKLEHNSIDNEGIREEVDTFLFEGYDTTSAIISLLLMLLANHRDIQDKIFEEIKGILGESEENPTFNNLQDMNYTERCIKEGLRIYPSVHFISRRTGEEYTTKTGYVIPNGTIVHVPIWDVHRIPEFWPEPEKFNPDRFLPENCKGRHPYSYIPFSAGPRNCIGQRFAILEIKAVLCGILRNFVLEPVDTPDTIKLIPHLVLRTANGIKMKFRKR